MRLGWTAMLVGCFFSLSIGLQASGPKQSTGSQAAPILGKIEKRNLIITILKTNQGTLYDVHTRTGRVIAQGHTPKMLRERHPHIMDFIEKAYSSKLDASVPSKK